MIDILPNKDRTKFWIIKTIKEQPFCGFYTKYGNWKYLFIKDPESNNFIYNPNKESCAIYKSEKEAQKAIEEYLKSLTKDQFAEYIAERILK